jgi:hypothetical protein
MTSSVSWVDALESKFNPELYLTVVKAHQRPRTRRLRYVVQTFSV